MAERVIASAEFGLQEAAARFLDDDDLAGHRADDALGGEGAGAASEIDLDHVGALPLRRHRLRRAQHVENTAGVAARRFGRQPRVDALVRAKQHDMATLRLAPRRHQRRQQILQAIMQRSFVAHQRRNALEPVRQDFSDGDQVTLHRRLTATVLVKNLHEGAEEDRHKKRDDECRNGPA